MRSEQTLSKLKKAVEKDLEIVCAKADVATTLGSDANYLLDVLGITKSDLVRLERLGFAVRALYDTGNRRNKGVVGPLRVRWVIFKEALE